MHKNKNLWRTYCYLLPELTCLFLLQNSMVKALDHVLESLSCVSKLQANGLTCHPFIGG
jgi:hypothetical protein